MSFLSSLGYVRSALACLLPVMGALTPALVHAQYVRFEGIADPGYIWSKSWVDVNADGRDDFCSLTGSNAGNLQCYLSDGTTFTYKNFAVSATGAWQPTMRWADVNGDGQLDLCRPFGNPNVSTAAPSNDGKVTCWIGPGFTQTVEVAIPLRWTQLTSQPSGGFSSTQRYGLSDWKRDLYIQDVDGDRRSDVCYVFDGVAKELRCLLSTGTAFGSLTAAWTKTSFDGGLVKSNTESADYPRGFFDVNGDGFADFCRIMSNSTLRCLLGSASGFRPSELSSPAISIPHREGAEFVDLNGDGKTDFCRIVGASPNHTLRCVLSNGAGFEGVERVSTSLDPGDALRRWWVDINSDGFPDFCRGIGSTMSCRLSRGDGDGVNASAFAFTDVKVDNADFGSDDGGRQFCDASGTGMPTFCRVTYRAGPSTQECYVGESGDYCYTVGSSVYGVFAGLTNVELQARHALLTAFSDGVGAEMRVTYLPASNPGVYTRSAIGTNLRSLIVQPRMPLVYETRAWRTAGSTQHALTGNARYFYKDLRTDSHAGSLGFRERWIFTEGSNTLDHVVYFQGLGLGIDASSILNDSREVGVIKYQERFAVADGLIPTPSNVGSQRRALVDYIASAARQLGTVPASPPTSASPFVLLQRTTNTLNDTTPANPRFRFIGGAITENWDWNTASASLVPMPKSESITTMSSRGNVLTVEQKTTAPNGSVWKKTTTNTYGQDDETTWTLGRLTRSTVRSESPTAADQIAAHGRSPGRSPTASSVSSALPPAAQPMSPAVLSAILQLLLED